LYGTKGTIALKRIAPFIVFELEIGRLAAMFAPLEKPNAIVLFKLKLYTFETHLTKSARSLVLIF